jgi:hypothetical protein
MSRSSITTEQVQNPTEGFWMGLQAEYELLQPRREIGSVLATIRPPVAA